MKKEGQNRNGNGHNGSNTRKTISQLSKRNGKPGHVLITGGAGFIGANLAHRLLSLGNRVVLLDNLSRQGVEKNLQWLIETHGNNVDIEVPDVRNLDAVKAAVKHATQVFHLAAQVAVTSSLVDPIEDFEINARGTLNLLEAIRLSSHKPSLVFTSTNKVYGDLADLNFIRTGTRYGLEDRDLSRDGISERRPLDFHSPYGCSKGAADQYVLDYARTYKLPAVVFRMSCIYGPHQFGNEDQGWVAHLLITSLAGKPITIYGDGMQVRDILYVDDLIDAFLLAQQHIQSLSGQAFNIGGGPENTVSLLELIDLIREMGDGTQRLHFEKWRLADQRFYVSDTAKFRSATGWHPKTNVREGVKKLHDWLRREVPTAQAKELVMPTHVPAPARRSYEVTGKA